MSTSDAELGRLIFDTVYQVEPGDDFYERQRSTTMWEKAGAAVRERLARTQATQPATTARCHRCDSLSRLVMADPHTHWSKGVCLENVPGPPVVLEHIHFEGMGRCLCTPWKAGGE